MVEREMVSMTDRCTRRSRSLSRKSIW